MPEFEDDIESGDVVIPPLGDEEDDVPEGTLPEEDEEDDDEDEIPPGMSLVDEA
jgi:hypothetical protein